jgi:DNA-binding CsgD family transcriptional regulator
MMSSRIFISWSGQRSHSLAVALKEWLPDVIHDVQVWVSSHTIQAGANWATKLSEILAECQLGIAIVTPENQRAPWLLFEAGAISRSLEEGRLIPLLLDLAPENLEMPIAQYQTVQADRGGIQSLLEAINNTRPNRISQERLLKYVERWWTDLERQIHTAKALPPEKSVSPARSDRELLTEVLQSVRAIAATRSGPDAEHITCALDSGGYFGDEHGRTTYVSVPETISIERFLDVVYGVLTEQGELPPHRYGDLWVLKNERSERVYTELDADDPRRAILGHLPISTLEIFDGDRLKVLKVERKSRGDRDGGSPLQASTLSAEAILELNGKRIKLTERQLQILALLAEGLPNKLIARKLGISSGTVKVQVYSILQILGVQSRLQAVVAFRNLMPSGAAAAEASNPTTSPRTGVYPEIADGHAPA